MTVADQLRYRVVQALLPALATRVRALLLPRFEAVRAAQAEARALSEAIGRAQRDAASLDARLASGPFHGGMTVHAAHARHGSVAEIFARRGLPACTDCAVGADETLAEAARGEAFSLEELVSELNELRTRPAPPPAR